MFFYVCILSVCARRHVLVCACVCVCVLLCVCVCVCVCVHACSQVCVAGVVRRWPQNTQGCVLYHWQQTLTDQQWYRVCCTTTRPVSTHTQTHTPSIMCVVQSVYKNPPLTVKIPLTHSHTATFNPNFAVLQIFAEQFWRVKGRGPAKLFPEMLHFANSQKVSPEKRFRRNGSRPLTTSFSSTLTDKLNSLVHSLSLSQSLSLSA